MTARWVDHFGTGIHSARPAASAVPKGAMYACSTHGLIYQSDGASTWSTWATLGATAGNDVTLVEETTPSSPSAGSQKLFIDSVDHKVKRVNSSGTVTTVEGASATFIGARVYNSAAISVANNGQVLTFDSERFDTDTIHSTSSNTSRLTCFTAGKYRISGTILFANNNNGLRGLQIQLNGATIIAIVRVPSSSAGTDTIGLTIDTLYDMAVNDYVELFAYQSSGVAVSAMQGAAYSPEFMMHRVG